MIPREHLLKFLLAATILSVSQSQNSRSYDTNDWIPITNKCPTCFETEKQDHHVIEKKATDKVLNLAEPDPSRGKFFPEEQSIRSKKSNRANVQQYLREVSPPAKRLPKRQHEILQQQPLELRGIPVDIQQQLNQGEFVNQQYFRQRPFQDSTPVREYQKQLQQIPQQVQLTNQAIIQQNPQLHPAQLIVPQGQPYFPGNQQYVPRPLFDIPLVPEGLNVYQPAYQNNAPAAQKPISPGIIKSNVYESLNPGIQAINQGLSGDSLTSSNINNNYKDLRQITLTSTSPKPAVEKETVQLVYVPLESLNQRQQQLQNQQSTVLQQEQQQAALQQVQLKVQEEEQLKARQEQLQRIQQEQQLKTRQELQLKAQQDAELKARQEQELKAQQEVQLKAQEEEQRKAQQEHRLKVQQEEALLQQQLQQQQEQALQQPQLQIQNQQTLLLEQQPLQPVQFIDQTPKRRKPTRPQIKQQYQTRVSSNQNESPLEHKQLQLQSIQNDFAQQALGALKLQLQLQEDPSPVLLSQPSSTTTAQTPTTHVTAKKRKPHQPPLAVYMESSGAVSVSDVLNILKNAKSISVQDSVGPQSPQVFVGPHNLEPPDGYTKFELPYLSALENNRVERKVDQLPFFVAPLSYKTPPGYSKIPLPAPHVGSVVISQPEQLNEKREQPPYRLENLLHEDPYRLPSQATYLVDQQQRPIQPFRLENAINEAPFRLPTQPQQVLDPFSSPLVTPPPLLPVTSRPDLLGQTINQYELEQINNQFLPQPQPQPQLEYRPAQLQDSEQNEYEEVTVRQQARKSNRVISTTPTLIPSRTQPVTELPREVHSTTRRAESRSRRPTQRTTISTQSNVDKTRYTVLEEFTAKQRATTANALDYNEESIISSTPSSTSQLYSSNLQNHRQQVTERVPTSSTHSSPQPLSLLPQPGPELLPQSVTRLVPQPQPQQELTFQQVGRQTATQQPQQLLNQDILDSQILQQPIQQGIPTGTTGVHTYFQLDSNGRYVPVQNIDENPYKLVHQQQFEQEVEAFRTAAPLGPTTALPFREIETTTVRLTEKPTEQTTRANIRGSSRSRTRGRTHYVPETSQEETSEEKTKEVENYKLPAELPSIHPGLHSLINDLQNQAIRPLLTPASIAPTTEHASRATAQRHRQQFASLSSVEQLEQELITQTPVHQQRSQFASLSPVQQLEQELKLQTPVRQQQQFVSLPEVQQLEQELASQPPLQQQRQQLASLSPVAQLEQQIATEPSIEQQQQQQFVSQQVQQLEHQFRSQSPVQQVEPQYVLVSSTEAQSLSTNSPSPITYPLTTAAPIETTTPNRRQRGRQRARGSTTTPPTRTTPRTRKASGRTRSEINRYQQELDDYVDYIPVRATESRTRENIQQQQQQIEYATEAPRRSSSRQRSRTRGRPQQEIQQLTERTINTNIADENAFRQPQLQSGFQASGNPLLQPQSYMQFEQPFELVPQNEQPKVQVVAAERNHILKQYNPVYIAEQPPLTSTEQLPIPTKTLPVEPQKLSVDVLITHPITEPAIKAPVIIPQSEEDIPYVRFSSNVESSGRGRSRQESEEITTHSSQARTRGRGRGRSRTKTTPRPTTTTVSHVKTTTEEQEEEFYGFIRPPNYNRPPPRKEHVVEPKLYSATYLSSTGKSLRVPNNAATVQYEDQPPENSNAVPVYSKNAISTTPRVQFVGKLRPKFQPSTVKHQERAEVTTEEITTEKRFTIRTTKPTYSPKAKIRGRPRQTTKKPQSETTRPVVQKPTRTPPSEAKGHRFKPRGTSAYQLPENLKSKSEDEDVAGGNYPAPFLKAQEEQTDRPKFQITIDPGLEENQSDEDQLPYSSIYRPKIIRQDASDVSNAQGSSEISALPLHNDIPIDRKNVESQEQSSTPTSIFVAAENSGMQDKNDTDIVKGIMEEFMGEVDEADEEVVSSSSTNPIDDLDSKEESDLNINNKPKSRRRGIWRLVKRPVDTFETAESQYVSSVIANSFSTNEKSSPTKEQSHNLAFGVVKKGVYDIDVQKQVETTTAESKEPTKASSLAIEVTPQPSELYSSKTTESFFDSLYKMFGMEEQSQQKETADENKSLHDKGILESDKAPSQIEEEKIKSESFYAVPLNSEDISLFSDQTNESDVLSNKPLETRPNNLSIENETNQADQLNLQNILQPPILITDASLASQLPPKISESLDPQLEPWDFGVKTSTSTEVSHETEICYRGRCVKSSGTKIPTL